MHPGNRQGASGPLIAGRDDEGLVWNAAKEGAPFVVADSKTVGDGSYPLSRYLYAYLSDTTDPAAVEFLRFVLSYDGQQIVAVNSATSLPAPYAEKQRAPIAK